MTFHPPSRLYCQHSSFSGTICYYQQHFSQCAAKEFVARPNHHCTFAGLCLQNREEDYQIVILKNNLREMGETASKLVWPFKNFNVKNRALRLISREKPIRAPYHPTTVKYLEKMLIEASPPVQRIHLQRLKRIYVTSKDPTEVQVANSKRANSGGLPLNRKPVADLAFGYLEPRQLTTGKISLRQALSFIGRHHSEPKKWKVSVISQQYQLRYNVTLNILQYFTPFKTFMADNEKEEWHANTRKLRRMVAGKPKVLALKNE